MANSLLTQLERYRPWDTTEAAHQAAILDLLQSPTAFDRHSYQPGHITGSAWVLAADRVALIYHRRLKRWLQPGGHCEPGEQDGLSTALREVKEELGLMLPTQASLFDLDVHRIPETATQPSHLHFDIRYLCRTDPQPLRPDTDAASARWFTIAELQAMELDASLRRMVEKGQIA